MTISIVIVIYRITAQLLSRNNAMALIIILILLRAILIQYGRITGHASPVNELYAGHTLDDT